MKRTKMKLETLEQGHYYHIYNRGNDGEVIFKNDENKRYFLSLVAKHLEGIVSVLAYCLLDNHYHFLVRIDENKSITTQKFSNLFNAYAKAYNKRFNRTGSLFEKHFRRKRIKDDTYLKNLIIYIHLNPIKHRLVSDLNDFKFSSYLFITNPQLNVPVYLEIEETVGYFDDLENFKFVHRSDATFGDEVNW